MEDLTERNPKGLGGSFFNKDPILLTPSQRQNLLVIGGGIIGLLSGFFLSRAGHRVTLLERGFCGQESSWAGGGIVSPLYPWRYLKPIDTLARWSQQAYAQWCPWLYAQTGIDPELLSCGLTWCDLPDKDQALHWSEKEALNWHEEPMTQVYARLPHLPSDIKQAIHAPHLAHLRPPKLMKALLQQLGHEPNFSYHPHQEVISFVDESSRIMGVRTQSQTWRADAVIVCGGAWSAHLLGSVGLQTNIVPRKGQMLLFGPNAHPFSGMILRNGHYAIPRSDGHVLVGSTMESVGFDRLPTQEAHDILMKAALDLWPPLAKAPLLAQWTGLRPGTDDGIPWIGESPFHRGLWLNCGHFRNGIVLAPASCALLSQLIAEQTPVFDPNPYAPITRCSEAIRA